ncbi:hypothetical protein ACHAXM_010361 [Skeletonema potamos]
MAMTNNRLPAEDNDTTPLLTIQRPLYFAILFLSLTILIDTTYTIIFSGQSSKSSGVVGGPLQNLAEFIIPQLVIRFSGPLLFATEETGIDGKICPPDGFLDRGLLTTYTNQNEKNGQQQQTNGIIYSNDFDPRNKIPKPSSFPHCELKKWVQIASNTDTNDTPNNKGSRQCPEGEEYVTYIYPTQQQHQQERKNTNVNNNNNNDDEVKIIHLATPTNCIPTSTIASLQSFTQHYSNNSNPQIIIAIYIHSQEAMDAFLYQRAWNVFPEVKEGLLCGMAKRAFNDMGRNTDTAALTAGLNYVLGKDWGNQSKLIGNANKCDVDNTKSVRFLNGNDILPNSLASPMQDMIPVVKRHVDDKSELPDDDTVIIKSFRGMEADFEKKRKEDEKLSSKNDAIFFSCMEYRLQAYTSNVPVA